MDIKQLERELRKAEKAAKRAMRARAALPPGTSRARVTSANARWAAAVNHPTAKAGGLMNQARG